MPQTDPGNSRLTEPLSAVLIAAGFFIFLALFLGLGPLKPGGGPGPGRASGGWEKALGAAARVTGSPRAVSGDAEVDGPIADLACLRAQGAGLIVVEAWLDAPPQADLRAYDQAVRARFEALPGGALRSAGLAMLSATSASLDGAQRLAAAVQGAQPLLLPFRAAPGGGMPLPDALKAEAYGVSLRGDNKVLAPYRALSLPFAELLQGQSGLGAVPPVSGGAGDPVPAVLGLGGLWVNSLGLEAFRRVKGLPLDGLHYRWSGGVLSSVEVANVRYPLLGDGGYRLPPGAAACPVVPIDGLRAAPASAQALRGKTVFYRPWALDSADAQAFDGQSGLFLGLMAGEPAGAGPSGWGPAALEAAAALALVLALGYAPWWLALLAGLLSVLGGCFLAADGVLAMVQAAALLVAASCAGLGWRLKLSRWRAEDARNLLMGVVAPGRQEAWRRRLASGEALLPAVYVVLGPRALALGAPWEAWMERWGAFLDEGIAGDRLGFAFAGPDAEEDAAGALLDLRRQDPSVRGALALGELRFRPQRRLGLTAWELGGALKERVVGLGAKASQGQLILSAADAEVFRDFFEAKALAGAEAEDARDEGGLACVLGPKTGLWKPRS